MAAKKDKTAPAPLPEADILSSLNKHRSKIITFTTVTILIIIISVVLIQIDTKKEEKAWTYFSDYLDPSYPTDSITDTTINELLSTVEGSDAEPWAIYYCSHIYMKNRNYDAAKKMLDMLAENFPHHFICMNSSLFNSSKDLIDKELNWNKGLEN